jgi:hypothetical protein
MKVVLRGELMNICVDLFYLKGLYVHMLVYITQLLTNGTQHFPPTPRWLCSTCNLEENDMKMLVGIFSNALYTYAPRCRTFPKKDGWGWVYKINRSHLRILIVKHTNIMYIYFFDFKSHFNWNMSIGCFLIEIARLIAKWVKIITEIGVFIRGEKLQTGQFWNVTIK